MKFLNNKLDRVLNDNEKRLVEDIELVVNTVLKKEVFSMTFNPLRNDPQDLFGFSVSLKFGGNKDER